MATTRKPDGRYVLDIGQINYGRTSGLDRVGTARRYGGEDTATARARLAQRRARSGTQFGWQEGDINTSKTRRAQDYGVGNQRADYDRNTALGRLAYQRTAAVRGQQESNNNQGLFYGGRGREAVDNVNRSFDESQHDYELGYGRSKEDRTTSFNRGNDDDATSLDRLAKQRAWSTEDFDNSNDDINTGEKRANEGFDAEEKDIYGRYGTGTDGNYGIEGLEADAGLNERSIAEEQAASSPPAGGPPPQQTNGQPPAGATAQATTGPRTQRRGQGQIRNDVKKRWQDEIKKGLRNSDGTVTKKGKKAGL